MDEVRTRSYGEEPEGLDLTVKLTSVRPADVAAPSSAAGFSPPVCDRCHNVTEVVVAKMEIVELGQAWSLCGSCARELPARFFLA
jgi:hypothetical protein